MPNEFEEFATRAAQMTDDHFKNQFSSLSSLNDSEITTVINDTGISKEDLAKVLKEVKDATSSNETKANAIKNINGGVSVLVGIAKKFL